MFFLKKLISAVLMPMPVCLAAIAVGLALLWFTKRQRAGKIVATAGFGALLLLSYGVVADLLAVPLENDHQPLLVAGSADSPDDARARQARWIVVLGGGHSYDPELPPNSQASVAALARLVEGVRLKKQLPAAKLIVSGAYGAPHPSHAKVLASIAETMGVARADIVLEERTYDTHDEAMAVRNLAGAGTPVILVSSATHLPRAAALFRKQGLAPLPSPADFVSVDAPGVDVGSFFPDAGPLTVVQRSWHEYLGTIFSKLRGQI